MTKKLIQHGNSAALIIDKAILELLHVDINTPLEIATDGKNLIISPQSAEHDENDILESLQRINRKHRKVLKKLAE
jgi:antitoxin component of MazEF toxin-antitoxin module